MGEEAQVGRLESMSAQHQVRTNLHSKHERACFRCSRQQGVGREPITDGGQTFLMTGWEESTRSTECPLERMGQMLQR